MAFNHVSEPCNTLGRVFRVVENNIIRVPPPPPPEFAQGHQHKATVSYGAAPDLSMLRNRACLRQVRTANQNTTLAGDDESKKKKKKKKGRGGGGGPRDEAHKA